jgi:hypothetical protein
MVRVGVFPEREEILVGLAAPGRVARERRRARLTSNSRLGGLSLTAPAYHGAGGLARVSLPSHRPEVAVQPVQGFADHLDPWRHVPRVLEDHVPLVLGRRSEELEHWFL